MKLKWFCFDINILLKKTKYWLLTKSGEVRRDSLCLDYNDESKDPDEKFKIYTRECHSMGGNQKWAYEDRMIRHVESNWCLEMVGNNQSSPKIVVEPCNQNNINQLWKWPKREKKYDA
jgi:hypothetical protein